MERGLWMGGTTGSFNPLETQFSIITRCMSEYLIPALARKLIQPNITYSLNQRYAEPSEVREYMRLNSLS